MLEDVVTADWSCLTNKKINQQPLFVPLVTHAYLGKIQVITKYKLTHLKILVPFVSWQTFPEIH